jgi:hypothetical protein
LHGVLLRVDLHEVIKYDSSLYSRCCIPVYFIFACDVWRCELCDWMEERDFRLLFKGRREIYVTVTIDVAQGQRETEIGAGNNLISQWKKRKDINNIPFMHGKSIKRYICLFRWKAGILRIGRIQ